MPETHGTFSRSVTIRGVRVKVLFFGLLRDMVGCQEESLELDSGSTLDTVYQGYVQRFPRLAELASSIVIARNAQFSPAHTMVTDGDEIAFLPPVSGGTGKTEASYLKTLQDAEGNFFALTREPIDTKAIIQQILRGEDGAFVDFQGVVRNNTKGRATLFLDYEGYEEMALNTLANLGREIAGNHAIGRVAMVHRLGRMQVGETSVAIVVTAPHRKPAFDAALEGINRLKKTVPIWKKEHFADGEVWVEGDWDDSVRQR